MFKLKNKYICAEISEKGAEILSLTHNGDEYFFRAATESKKKVGTVKFPLALRVNNSNLEISGQEYKITPSDIAGKSVFSLKKRTKSSVVLELTENEDTLSLFPQKFKLQVKYTIFGRSLTAIYKIKNTSQSDMFFSFSSNNAVFAPNGTEEYDMIFPLPEKLEKQILKDGLITGNTEKLSDYTKHFALYNSYFGEDKRLYLGHIKNTKFTVKSRKTGRAFKFIFNGFDNLQIDSIVNPQAIRFGFIYGGADSEDSNPTAENKKCLKKLSKGKSVTLSQKIIIKAGI